MPDVFTPEKRSEVMSRIRGVGNKSTELRLISIFRKHRITGWRRRQKLPGKPDFVFRRERLCVFVDGCFWHGCRKCYQRPASNQTFWDEKKRRNHKRDLEVSRELKASDWRVLRIWEHELAPKNESHLTRRIDRALKPTVAKHG